RNILLSYRILVGQSPKAPKAPENQAACLQQITIRVSIQRTFQITITMVWPKLVGSVVIRERAPRYPNEPRYKRLDFIREKKRPDLDEWDLVSLSKARQVVIVQETNGPPPSEELPPAPPLYIQQPEYYDPYYHLYQHQYQQYQPQQHYQPQGNHQCYYQQQPNVPPPPPHHPPRSDIRPQPQMAYHDPFQRRIEYPDRQADIIRIPKPAPEPVMANRRSGPCYVEAKPRSKSPGRTRVISSKEKRSMSRNRRLIRGDSVYASDYDNLRGGHRYYSNYESDDSLDVLVNGR
ncbi:MAG: hypothetical protein Q9187_005990, partial [Circinaria calcarea]